MSSAFPTISQTKLHGYNNKSRHVISLYNELKEEGPKLDIELPAVVLCGNQNAGKTSLIEAICGIRLPRSDILSTRCPMELRLSEASNDSKCSVSLIMSYDEIADLSYPVPKVHVFLDGISSLNSIELATRRAQKAILNPSQDYHYYTNYFFDDSSFDAITKDNAKNELKFSRNKILIKIHEAHLNFNLIDLPGYIKLGENFFNQNEINCIQAIYRNHIESPRNLILAVISCKDEVSNQSILSLANEVDPKGNRTMGVLTKPDTIESDCHDPWLQVLNNHRVKLKLGFYIIKNPNKTQLQTGVNFVDARKTEAEFFVNNQPWSNAYDVLRLKFGANNLRIALCNHLSFNTEQCLKELYIHLRQLDTKTKSDLLAPPPITKNPKKLILKLINDFSQSVKDELDINTKKAANQSIKSYFIEFRQKLIDSRPILILPQGIELDQELLTSKSNSNSQLLEDLAEYYIQSEFSPSETCFTTDRINDLLDTSREKLLGTTDTNHFLMEVLTICQKSWKELSTICFHGVVNKIKTIISLQIKFHFGQYKLLADKVKNYLDQLIKNHIDKTNDVIELMVDSECSTITTQDLNYLNSLSEKIHTIVTQALDGSTSTTDPDIKEYSDSCFPNQSQISRQLPSQTFLNYLSPESQSFFQTAQAYHLISLRRWGDFLPMIINRSLIRNLTDSIYDELIDSLHILDEDTEDVSRLIESTSLTNLRLRLTTKLARLDTILDNILVDLKLDPHTIPDTKETFMSE